MSNSASKKLEAQQHNAKYERGQQEQLAYEIMNQCGLTTRPRDGTRNTGRRSHARGILPFIALGAAIALAPTPNLTTNHRP